MNERLQLRNGLKRECGSSSEAAKKIFVSKSELSKICGGTRKIPRHLKPEISSISIEAGTAILIEDTGWHSLFDYFEDDRHPQTLLRMVEKEDCESDEALKGIGWRTIGKNSRDDLTSDDEAAMRIAARELIDDVRAKINLLIEWDARFPQLGIKGMLKCRAAGKSKGVR